MKTGTWGAWDVIYEDTGWKYWWYADSSNYAGYRKKNGWVQVASKSTNGKTIASKRNIKYTLPEGYRPINYIGCLGSEQDYRGYEMQFDINPSGVVALTNLDPANSCSYWEANITFIPDL